MARLTWGDLDKRLYHAGVDRGVLFVGDNAGEPWNGLTAVEESPTGGGATPYYLEGLKVVNIAAAEEFEATISAFSSPRGFDACDGVTSLANGLFATQQPRIPFNFTYRTLIGNYEHGLANESKVHLVYNALAAPSSRSNATIGSSAEPLSLSWAITTLPPAMVGLKPTAHIVIDTSIADSEHLAEFDSILYGSDEADARFPSVAELQAIFSAP